MAIVAHAVRLERQYVVSSACSCANLLSWFLLIASIVATYAIAYGTHNMWLVRSSYYEQPAIAFAHDYMVEAETSDGVAMRYSSFPNYNEMAGSSLRVPTIKVPVLRRVLIRVCILFFCVCRRVGGRSVAVDQRQAHGLHTLRRMRWTTTAMVWMTSCSGTSTLPAATRAASTGFAACFSWRGRSGHRRGPPSDRWCLSMARRRFEAAT